MQFLIPLRKQGEPLYRQVYLGLRDAILGGTFPAGARLPSTRDLAEQLGVSRTVVVGAYEQLLSERFVTGKPGSGTFVPQSLTAVGPSHDRRSAPIRLSVFGHRAAASSGALVFPVARPTPLRFDFSYGQSDIASFPFELWRRILIRRARQIAVKGLDYGPTNGSPALREAIATHLRRSRAVACDASQVIVTNGSQQALDLIIRVLVEPGDRVVLEDPHYQGTRELLKVARTRLLPVPVDRDGLRTDALPSGARLAFVTPSHQQPTGVTLTLPRRQALLAWARRNRAVIVEDDYDAEIRYDGKPLESLQALDRDGRVIYVGTFSRTVFSSLRLGYLVVPPSLLTAFTAAKWLCDRHTATLEQETLAEFISSGLYERHLRRLRRQNAATRTVLLEAVDALIGSRVEITGAGAGAHVVLWLPTGTDEAEVERRAAAQQVGVYGIRRYHLGRARRPALILGYPRMRRSDIREGVRRLSEVI